MPDYEEIGRYVGRYGSIRLTRSELFPLLNAMHSRDSYKASCESLQAENAALRRIVEAAREVQVRAELAGIEPSSDPLSAAIWELMVELDKAAPDTEGADK